MAQTITPYFASAAKADQLYLTDLKSVPAFLAHANESPHRTAEFEFAILSAFRRSGLDPTTEAGWERAHIIRQGSDSPITYTEAAESIRSSYIKGAGQSLTHLAERAKTDPYDYVRHDPKTKLNYGGTIGPSGLASAAQALRNANLDPDTNEAWQAAGFEDGLRGLRDALQDSYVKAKVGNYADIEGKDTDEKSRICADAHLREILPNAASALEVGPLPTIRHYGTQAQPVKADYQHS